MVRAIGVGLMLLATGAMTMAAAQETKQEKESPSGWTYPVIEDYGRAWPLPHAAIQPSKTQTYKAIFDLSKAAPNANEVLPGLAHAARMVNVFASLGVPPKNLRVVGVFHGAVGYAAMSNDAYRAKFNVDNPNIEIIEELKAAGVDFYLCGQTLHELKLDEKQMLPQVKLATSAMIVLVTFQNEGYALMPF